MITEFQGPNRFLSNFWIEPDGTCVEVEYQREKCPLGSSQRNQFDNATPGQAKRLGRFIKIRPDWEQIKLQVMEDLVTTKFVEHCYLRKLLLATGEEELIEGNSWGDCFWGVCRGKGQNHLGTILMKVRAKLARQTTLTELSTYDQEIGL